MNSIYRIFMYGVGSVIGTCIGLGLSVITMVILTMISTDKFFNAYIGICFLVLGIMMLAKLYRKNKIVNIDVGASEPNQRENQENE